MKFQSDLAIAVSLFLFMASCSTKPKPREQEETSNAFKSTFKDQGLVIDSIKKAYQCQSVELENWGDSDLTDSTLTICLINSNRPPSNQGDSGYIELKSIAQQISRVVTTPEKYHSYYIIFVKRDSIGGIVTRSHTAGADIPASAL
jgi:hypothetical protein